MKIKFKLLNREKNLQFLFLISLLLLSCGEEDIVCVSQEDTSGTYSKDNVFLEDKDLSYVISRTDEGKIHFSKKTPVDIIPEIGKVLAFPIDEKYPTGYYGKVKKITKQNGSCEVQLEPATIAELYPDTVLYYKGPVNVITSSRVGDDVNLDVNLDFDYVNITGTYKMMSPEVEYKVETSNGEVVGRSFRLKASVETKTKLDFGGKVIDKESDPFGSVYLVGGKFSKWFALGIKADFSGRIVGQIDFDASFTHTMQAQMNVGFSAGEHFSDSISREDNNIDVSINDLQWSKFKKAKGEIGFGISLKAYTEASFIKWKLSTDDNLYLRVSGLVNFKSDFDYRNFDYKKINNEIEVGRKIMVDYKAGFYKEDNDGNNVYFGWGDSADWYMKWETLLIWPEFSINEHNYWTTSALLGVKCIKDEAILSFCDKALVWYEMDTNKMSGIKFFTFTNKYEDILIDGLIKGKNYIIYPSIKVGENEFIRVYEPYTITPFNLDGMPDYDWWLP